MHPALEEFLRAHPHSTRPEAFRRWQRLVKTEIGPALDRIPALEAEIAQLREQVEKLTAKKPKAVTA